MRLCVADPPYLGRAARWYGIGGRGSGGGLHRADEHPEAGRWDKVETHLALIDQLGREYDGWALFCGVHALRHLLPATPEGTLVLSWDNRTAVPSGSRILSAWEPVLVSVPRGRSAHGTGLACRSAYAAPHPQSGFAGAKPASVTRWVLDVLGYRPDEDEVTDLFPGSGAVTAALVEGSLW